MIDFIEKAQRIEFPTQTSLGMDGQQRVMVQGAKSSEIQAVPVEFSVAELLVHLVERSEKSGERIVGPAKTTNKFRESCLVELPSVVTSFIKGLQVDWGKLDELFLMLDKSVWQYLIEGSPTPISHCRMAPLFDIIFKRFSG